MNDRKRIEEFGLQDLVSNMDILEPIDYLSLMGLMEHCSSVVTDSGGLQRESYYAHKPGYLLMPDPAWHEIVDLKMNYLCEPDNLYKVMNSNQDYNYVEGIHGDGKAGDKIVKIILEDN